MLTDLAFLDQNSVPFFARFETVWTVLNHFGPLWTNFGPFWIILDSFGPLWTTLDHFGPFWTILDHFEPFWTVLDHFGPFWTIGKPFGTVWNRFQPFWTVLKSKIQITLLPLLTAFPHYLFVPPWHSITLQVQEVNKTASQWKLMHSTRFIYRKYLLTTFGNRQPKSGGPFFLKNCRNSTLT